MAGTSLKTFHINLQILFVVTTATKADTKEANIIGQKVYLPPSTTLVNNPKIIPLSSEGRAGLLWSAKIPDTETYSINLHIVESLAGKVQMSSNESLVINSASKNEYVSSDGVNLNDDSEFLVLNCQESSLSNYDIYGQVYDKSADEIISQFRINSENTGNQIQPSVTYISDQIQNIFVATWIDKSLSTTSILKCQIYAYTSSKETPSKIGIETQLNTSNMALINFHAIKHLGDGKFVVTWVGKEQNSSNEKIYSCCFDVTSNPEAYSQETIITLPAENYVQSIEVMKISDEVFIIVWSSCFQSDTNCSIYKQNYSISTGSANAQISQVELYSELSTHLNVKIVELESSGYGIFWTIHNTISSDFAINAIFYNKTNEVTASKFSLSEKFPSLVESSEGSDIIQYRQKNYDAVMLNNGKQQVTWHEEIVNNKDNTVQHTISTCMLTVVDIESSSRYKWWMLLLLVVGGINQLSLVFVFIIIATKKELKICYKSVWTILLWLLLGNFVCFIYFCIKRHNDCKKREKNQSQDKQKEYEIQSKKKSSSNNSGNVISIGKNISEHESITVNKKIDEEDVENVENDELHKQNLILKERIKQLQSELLKEENDEQVLQIEELQNKLAQRLRPQADSQILSRENQIVDSVYVPVVYKQDNIEIKIETNKGTYLLEPPLLDEPNENLSQSYIDKTLLELKGSGVNPPDIMPVRSVYGDTHSCIFHESEFSEKIEIPKTDKPKFEKQSSDSSSNIEGNNNIMNQDIPIIVEGYKLDPMTKEQIAAYGESDLRDNGECWESLHSENVVETEYQGGIGSKFMEISKEKPFGFRRRCIPEHFLDSCFSGDILSDPVTMSSGKTYERKSIEGWFKKNGLKDPYTRDKISEGPYKTNTDFKNAIEYFQLDISVDEIRFNDNLVPMVKRWIDKRGRDKLLKDPMLLKIVENYDEAVVKRKQFIQKKLKDM